MTKEHVNDVDAVVVVNSNESLLASKGTNTVLCVSTPFVDSVMFTCEHLDRSRYPRNHSGDSPFPLHDLAFQGVHYLVRKDEVDTRCICEQLKHIVELQFDYKYSSLISILIRLLVLVFENRKVKLLNKSID